MECGIWLLIIMALASCFSTDQLSPAGTDSTRTCARLCKMDFVLHKYLLFISDTREQLAYEWHLSTYPPSNRYKRYYSKWLPFVSPHATRPTYISPGTPQKMQQNMQKWAVSTGWFLRYGYFYLQVANCHLFLAKQDVNGNFKANRYRAARACDLWTSKRLHV